MKQSHTTNTTATLKHIFKIKNITNLFLQNQNMANKYIQNNGDANNRKNLTQKAKNDDHSYLGLTNPRFILKINH